MPTMRAFQIDKPGAATDLRRIELPVPEPGPGQVRVRVAYCGLNPLDIIVRSGGAAWMAPKWPIVLGVEHSGVVDAVGEGVDPAWLGRGVIAVINPSPSTWSTSTGWQITCGIIHSHSRSVLSSGRRM